MIIKERQNKHIPGGTSLFLSFDFNQKIIDAIKATGYYYYDKKTHEWEVPLTSLAQILDSVCYYDDIALDLLSETEVGNRDLQCQSYYKSKPFDYQLDGIRFGLNHDNFLLLDVAGLGKAFTLDTPVLTPGGFKPIGQLKVGDSIYGRDGSSGSVEAVYDHKQLKMYDLVFTDGIKVTCCKDHLWLVNRNKSYKKGRGKEVTRLEQDVVSTEWLLTHFNKKSCNVSFPRCKEIEFTSQKVPVDPYLLGCLLGDGSLTQSTPTFTTADQYLVERMQCALPEGVECKFLGGYDYRLSQKINTSRPNPLTQQLRQLGLMGTNSQTKFVPDVYKYNSLEVRLEVLRGLMDTDGYAAGGRNNLLQFTTTSPQLRDDVMWLIRSLGGMVVESKRIPTLNGISQKEAYTLTVRDSDPSRYVALPRKKQLLHPRRTLPQRRLKSIEFAGYLPGRCLTVSTPDHTYVAKDFLVAHNTLQMIYLAEELKAKEGLEHCLIICGINTLKSNWEKEIKKHSRLDCVILGKKVTSTGKVSYTSIPDRCIQVKNKINEFFIIVNIETLRSSDFIEALRTSQNKIDMVVFDEMHRANSSQSQQAKGLMKLPNYKHKIGLTGTLITNNPINCFLPLKWIGKEHCNLTAFKSYYCEYSGPFHNDLVGFKNMGLLKEQIAECSLRRDKSMLNLPPKVYVEELLDMSDSQQRFYDEIKQGIKDQVDKVNLSTQSLLSMVTRLRQATVCPHILSSNDISSAKLERACELVDEIVDNGNKVVVFSTFKEPLKELSSMLDPKYGALLCTGDYPDDVISTNIDKFQNDDSYKVMLCTTSKMGTGVTLTAANYEIFLDTPWTAALLSQCEDRCHRVGTTDSVTIYKLICNGTIDERVADIVKTKEAISDYIIDDRISESTIENLRKYIMEL